MVPIKPPLIEKGELEIDKKPMVKKKQASLEITLIKFDFHHHHHGKQANNTRLTQSRQEPNLTRNRSHQTIAGEVQPSCRMKNDGQEKKVKDVPLVSQNKLCQN